MCECQSQTSVNDTAVTEKSADSSWITAMSKVFNVLYRWEYLSTNKLHYGEP